MDRERNQVLGWAERGYVCVIGRQPYAAANANAMTR